MILSIPVFIKTRLGFIVKYYSKYSLEIESSKHSKLFNGTGMLSKRCKAALESSIFYKNESHIHSYWRSGDLQCSAPWKKLTPLPCYMWPQKLKIWPPPPLEHRRTPLEHPRFSKKAVDLKLKSFAKSSEEGATFVHYKKKILRTSTYY